MGRREPPPPASLRPLYAVFAATGACALAYEVVWARSLALLLGVDAYAHAVVLGCFMGGQAAGFLWGARLAARAGRRIARYGALEAAIGALAVLFPLCRALADRAFLALASGADPGGAGVLGWKLAVAAALILPATVLMGATLPLLAEGAARAGADTARAVPRLYAANAAGAVLGALLAGYALVPALGLTRTIVLLGAANVALGALAALLSLLRYEPQSGGEGLAELPEPRPPPTPSLAPATSPDPAAPHCEATGPSPALARVAILGAFLTGAAALASEVAWTRLLALTLGASTYAFTIVLAAFVGGIAIGAAIAGTRRLALARDPLLPFGAAQLLLAAGAALTVPLADLLPLAFERTRALLEPTDRGFFIFQGLQLLLALLVLAAPTILGGISLPLAARAVSLLRGPARGVSRSFAANTLGSLAGALLAGLVLLPAVGLRSTFSFAIALNALAGGAALAAAPGARARRLLALPLALAVASLGVLLPSIERGALTFQVFRAARRVDPLEKGSGVRDFLERARRRGERIIYDRDGASATVTVLESSRGARTLLINGKADASTGEDMRTQMLLAHVPLLLRPEARRVLLVGLGCGVTAGSALTHPIERLDIVEISPEVVEASRRFDAATGAPLADARAHLVIDDARTALRLSTARYDAVISEPSNPWVAGMGNLFTREHFQAIAARLAPRGVALQWIHLYEISDELVDMVVRTFLEVFPHVRIFAERGQRDLLLLGTREPFDVDLDALERRFQTPAVRRDLAQDGLETLEALLCLELFGPGQAPLVRRPERAALAPWLEDDLPLLEARAPRAFFRAAMSKELLALATSPRRPPEPPGDRLLERWLARRPPTREMRDAVRRYLSQDPRMPWPELEPEDLPPQALRRSRLRDPRGAK